MMQDPRSPTIVRDLVISVFALNGRMIETGNQLTRHIGLTTASWQVIGALGYSPVPLPVAHIARNMGLSRQSVQRVVDLLDAKGFVRFEPNPHHQRAKLVVLTTSGRAALYAAEAAEEPLNKAVLEQVGGERVASAISVLTEMNKVITQMMEATGDDLNRNDAA